MNVTHAGESSGRLLALPRELLLAIFNFVDLPGYCTLLICCKTTRELVLDRHNVHTDRFRKYQSITLECNYHKPLLGVAGRLLAQMCLNAVAAPYIRSLRVDLDFHRLEICSEPWGIRGFGGPNELLRPSRNPFDETQTYSSAGHDCLSNFVTSLPVVEYKDEIIQLLQEWILDSGEDDYNGGDEDDLPGRMPLVFFCLPGLTSLSLPSKYERLLYSAPKNFDDRSYQVLHPALGTWYLEPLPYLLNRAFCPFERLTILEIISSPYRSKGSVLESSLDYAQLPCLEKIVRKEMQFDSSGLQEFYLTQLNLRDALVLSPRVKGCLVPRRAPFQGREVMVEFSRTNGTPYIEEHTSSMPPPISFREAAQTLLQQKFCATGFSPNPLDHDSLFMIHPTHIDHLQITERFSTINLIFLFDPKAKRNFSGEIPGRHCLLLVSKAMEVGDEKTLEVDVTLKFASAR